MILLENSESQKKLLEKKNEDLSKRLLENEKGFQSSQKELSRCKVSEHDILTNILT